MAVSERQVHTFRRVVIPAVLDVFALLLLAQAQLEHLNTGPYGLTIGIAGVVYDQRTT